MKWFYNLKLGAKLMTGFIMVAVIAAAIGYFGIKNMHAIDEADTMLYEKITIPINDLAEISTAFQRVRINLRDLVEAESAQERDKALETVKALRAITAEKSATFEKTILTDEGRKLFAQFQKTREAYG
ncbi:MAG: MCP four helix bundle domain-containing protein, partial [Verrucomicrobia bacterium]|nr:MCP four helix bundle domain-containing protein [Deltaproteobacteria bacterium]